MFKLIAALLFLPCMAFADGRYRTQVQPVYQDEGDEPVPYSVSCSSTAWTQIVSSDTISRSVLFYTPSDNTASSSICISTISSSFTSCVAGTAGTELTPDSALTDYTKKRWFCRARANGNGIIKGWRSRDKRDGGDIGNPALQ